jgi:hypothetical protein
MIAKEVSGYAKSQDCCSLLRLCVPRSRSFRPPSLYCRGLQRPSGIARRHRSPQFLQIGFEKGVGNDQRLDCLAGISVVSANTHSAQCIRGAGRHKGSGKGRFFGVWQLNFFDQLLGRNPSVSLGRVVLRRHDATHLIAPDVSSAALPDNGRPPAPRFSLVGDYRKLGDVSH